MFDNPFISFDFFAYTEPSRFNLYEEFDTNYWFSPLTKNYCKKISIYIINIKFPIQCLVQYHINIHIKQPNNSVNNTIIKSTAFV